MIRVSAYLGSAFLIGSLLVSGSAGAQDHRGKGAAAPARAAPAARPAPAPRAAPAPRIAAPQRSAPAPRMAAPQRSAPRIAAPQAGPRMQRNAPPAAARINRGAPSMANRPQFNRNAARDAARANRDNARNAARNNRDAAKNAARDNANKAADRAANAPQLNARERRQQAQTQRQIDRLQQRGKLNARQQQRLDRLQAQQQRFQNGNGNAQNRQNANQQANGLRRNGQPRVTAQAARQGRFVARFQNNPNWQAQRAARIAARVAARQAWRQNRRAAFVAWSGPVFWPYAYSDIFDYTFWPYAYDDAYWAYAYDDMFDSVYWASSPYADEYYAGPYEGGYAAAVPGGKPSARSRQVAQNAAQLCKDPGKGITAWPFERINDAVKPNAEQRSLLDDVKAAAAKAADDFRGSCADGFPMTPPGRLQAMVNRLQATLGAVRTVRPPLEKFYTSLTDEQQARFNAIGPDIGQDEAKNARNETQGAASNDQKACGGAKPGLTTLPIEAIEDAVQPNASQQAALDRLNEATDRAVSALQAECPDTIPLTPVGRLEVMEQRLDAMVNAANTVRPALDDFYASLNSEQKARFNTLGEKEASR